MPNVSSLLLSMDSEYLKSRLGNCLVDCLVDVSEKRPGDPIEFIAHWLYKYTDNVGMHNQVSTYMC